MIINLSVNGIVMIGYPVFAGRVGAKAFSTELMVSCLRFSHFYYLWRAIALILGLYIPDPSSAALLHLWPGAGFWRSLITWPVTWASNKLKRSGALCIGAVEQAAGCTNSRSHQWGEYAPEVANRPRIIPRSGSAFSLIYCLRWKMCSVRDFSSSGCS